MDPHGRGAYFLSLGFTFLGAGIFSLARTRRGHIPQEAFIGIAYAVASATAILCMSKATGETEHLKDMLVGNILAVSRGEVIKTAVLYGAIGVFHYFFRKKFLLISTDAAKAEASGLSIRFWDFLFYASFGFVVTSSVAIAGVLLVFCYLIVPSVGAMLFADKIGRRLAIGWTMGTLVSALGVYFSVLLDLPTGATIVCTFGAVLVLMFFVHLIFFHGRQAHALEGASSAAKEPVLQGRH
jgi:zinc/manganese transport system permease protein